MTEGVWIVRSRDPHLSRAGGFAHDELELERHLRPVRPPSIAPRRTLDPSIEALVWCDSSSSG